MTYQQSQNIINRMKTDFVNGYGSCPGDIEAVSSDFGTVSVALDYSVMAIV